MTVDYAPEAIEARLRTVADLTAAALALNAGTQHGVAREPDDITPR